MEAVKGQHSTEEDLIACGGDGSLSVERAGFFHI